MTKKELLEIAKMIPNGSTVEVVVSGPSREWAFQTTRWVDLRCSVPAFPSKVSRTGKTCTKTLAYFRNTENATVAAVKYLRWLHEAGGFWISETQGGGK